MQPLTKYAYTLKRKDWVKKRLAVLLSIGFLYFRMGRFSDFFVVYLQAYKI